MSLDITVTICATVIIVALIILAAYRMSLKAAEQDGMNDRQIREELKRMQHQCNDMYKFYQKMVEQECLNDRQTKEELKKLQQQYDQLYRLCQEQKSTE